MRIALAACVMIGMFIGAAQAQWTRDDRECGDVLAQHRYAQMIARGCGLSITATANRVAARCARQVSAAASQESRATGAGLATSFRKRNVGRGYCQAVRNDLGKLVKGSPR